MPGEAMGGLEVIENNRGGKVNNATRAGMSHELIPDTGSSNLMRDGGGMR